METDIHYKPTDTHNYVQFGSFHPHKTLTNIPFSLARRICLIVSNAETREFRLRELKGFLLKKKYPEAVIVSGISRASLLDREELLKSQTSSSDDAPSTMPFVYTNNSSNPDALNTLRRGMDLLLPSE